MNTSDPALGLWRSATGRQYPMQGNLNPLSAPLRFYNRHGTLMSVRLKCLFADVIVTQVLQKRLRKNPLFVEK
jgi:hypothetical protein